MRLPGPSWARPIVACAAAVALTLVGAAPAYAARPTGRYLVTFDSGKAARSTGARSALLARAGVRRAGPGAPALGIATVRGPAPAIEALRHDPAVRSVSREWYRDLRRTPNDPTLSTPETEYGGLPGGAPIQWSLAREGFPAAWGVTTGAGALVGVIDSGIDGAHPELAGKIASADSVSASGDPRSDPDGHGTHVSGLACAATNNGIGIAGAGWDCRLVLVKVPTPAIPDEAIVSGIRRAADRGARAINMSFGGGPPSAAIQFAIDDAVRRGVVLVAAASNDPDTDQGAPASQLQPGDAPNIDRGRGLVVTAADFRDRNPGTGTGNQVSLAAYGFYDPVDGPPGLISTYPAGLTERDVEAGCVPPIFLPTCFRRDLSGDVRYAYLQGTSMSAPQVTALAAMVAQLNPFLSLGDKLRLIKSSARRSGGWTPQLGWGILDAGRAIAAARRLDRVAPRSRLRARRRARVGRGRRRAAVRLRWSGRDPAGRAGLIPSGVRSYDVYLKRGHGRYRRVARRTRRHSKRLRLRRGVYRVYTRARDRAGNVERAPRRADVRLVVRRPRR
jgi:serine protease